MSSLNLALPRSRTARLAILLGFFFTVLAIFTYSASSSGYIPSPSDFEFSHFYPSVLRPDVGGGGSGGWSGGKVGGGGSGEGVVDAEEWDIDMSGGGSGPTTGRIVVEEMGGESIIYFQHYISILATCH